MQLTCLFHLTSGLHVTEDEQEYNRLIATGLWFDHPNKAKEERAKHEKRLQEPRLHDEKREGCGDSKQASTNGRKSARQK